MKNKEIGILKQASRIALKNKKWVLLSSFMDLLFFFVYGFATAPIYRKLVEYINVIGSFAGEAIQTATRESRSMSTILMDPAISSYFYDMILLLIILWITVYFLYCLFQAFNWKIALQLTGKKIRYLDYLKKFAVMNILWFVLFIAYYLLGFAIDIRKTIISAVMQTSPSSMLNIILAFFLIIIAYFAVISYVKISLKKAFFIGKSKIRQLLPSVLIIAIYILVLNIILALLTQLNVILAIVLGLILLIPAITFARIYISLITNKV